MSLTAVNAAPVTHSCADCVLFSMKSNCIYVWLNYLVVNHEAKTHANAKCENMLSFVVFFI